jgi:hypothetical protein
MEARNAGEPLRLSRSGPVCLALASSTSRAPGPESKPWRIGNPIVSYYAGPPMTDAVAKQMAEGGWNVVCCSAAAENLDVLHKYGLRAQIWETNIVNPEALDDPAAKAKLDALIDRLKTHPAMYQYFIVDEPSASRFPALGRLAAYLRERDPAHCAYINLFPT